MTITPKNSFKLETDNFIADTKTLTLNTLKIISSAMVKADETFQCKHFSFQQMHRVV